MEPKRIKSPAYYFLLNFALSLKPLMVLLDISFSVCISLSQILPLPFLPFLPCPAFINWSWEGKSVFPSYSAFMLSDLLCFGLKIAILLRWVAGFHDLIH